ncbi:MAG TPA: hypothetical protein VN947_34215 [Polyangia bacterium]|nr:hypothetical protein [Polyangia bacterium]
MSPRQCTVARALVGGALALGLGLALVASSVRAEEPEFQIVGTVEQQTLSLSILPRPGFRLGAETPVLVSLQGTHVELPRKLYRRADAVDPRAEAPRFEVPFRAPTANARIDAELTFYICQAARCRPVVTRYGTNL